MRFVSEGFCNQLQNRQPIGSIFDNWQAGGYAGGLGGCACPVTNPASFRPMGPKVDIKNTIKNSIKKQRGCSFVFGMYDTYVVFVMPVCQLAKSRQTRHIQWECDTGPSCPGKAQSKHPGG